MSLIMPPLSAPSHRGENTCQGTLAFTSRISARRMGEVDLSLAAIAINALHRHTLTTVCSDCDASLIVYRPLALWTILRRYRWLDLRACMAHALAPGPCVRFEPEFCSVLLHPW